MTPASVNFTAYREDDYPFAFILNDTDGNPFDLGLFGAVTMRVFRSERETMPLFTPTITKSSNIISGELTAEQTEMIRPIRPYYEIRTTVGDKEVTLFNGLITTKDARTGGASQTAVTATVDLGAMEIVVSVPAQGALAVQALASLQPPANTVVVDLAYTDSLASWQKGTVESALAFVRSQGGNWRVVVGLGFVLPDGESIYDLLDAGIDVQFTVDKWENWLKRGGTLDLDSLQYPIDLSRILRPILI